MPGWLKAGLIGGAVVFVLDLLGLIPFIACVTLPLSLVIYPIVGGLAASYLPTPRMTGQGASQGALAAVVAGLIGETIRMIIGLISTAMGGTAQALSQIPPETFEQLGDLGISPEMFAGAGSLGISAVCGSICCGIGVLIAAALGAIGGLIFAAAKPE